METGQTYTIDGAAVKEMASFYKRPENDFASLEGRVFSIAKSKSTAAVTDSEVRGTKWEDGKPQRGRPRKFPRAAVARLLGELDDASLQPGASTSADSGDSTSSDSSSDDSANLDDAAEQLIAAETPVAESVAPATPAAVADKSEDSSW